MDLAFERLGDEKYPLKEFEMGEMRRFRFEKIIRDKIPNSMQKKNMYPILRVLKGEERITKLKEKLREELEEFMCASDLEEEYAELADMLEVIHALSEALGESYENIEKRRLAKKKERGGFKEGVYCESVAMDIKNPEISYYDARPMQYLEIKS